MPETVMSNQPPNAWQAPWPPVPAAADTGPLALPRARDDAVAPPYTGPLVLPLTDAWLEELMRSGSAPPGAHPAQPTGLEQQVTVPRAAIAVAALLPRGSSMSRRMNRHARLVRVVAASLIALALLGAALVIRGDLGAGRLGGLAVPPVGPAAAPQAAPASPVTAADAPAAPSDEAAPAAQPASPGSPPAGQPPTALPGTDHQQREPVPAEQPRPAEPRPGTPDAGPPPAAAGPPVIVRQSATPSRMQVRGCPADRARVEAVITAASALTSVTLFWIDPASETARAVPMSQVGDTWVAQIGPVAAAGAIYWKIDARDAQNRLTTGPTEQLLVRAC